MTNPEADSNRRKLLAATVGMGCIWTAATAVPFIASMEPSEAAKAAGAPVEADVSAIAPGTLVTIEWRGKPVWILHRTKAMLAALDKHDELLADVPDEYRFIHGRNIFSIWRL